MWVLIRIASPCCGSSLESPRRYIFNAYRQHKFLWTVKQNYPLIITKYPPYLFQFLRTQRRLKSAWAFTQSDQSLRCPFIEYLRKVPRFLHADSEDSDQMVRMPCLICVFAGLTFHFVGFVMLQLFLIFSNSFLKKNDFYRPTDRPFSFG